MQDSYGLYDFLSRIDVNAWVEYGFILIATLFIIVRVLKPGYLTVLAVIVAAIIVYYRIDKRKSTLEDINDQLDYKLKSIYPQPQNLHMDANLVNLFYNIKDYRRYNSEAYDNALIAVDNVLKVVSEIEVGVYHCSENLDVVRDNVYKALNYLAAIIYRIPIPKISALKYQRVMNALHIILRRHIDDIYHRCKLYYSSKPIDINTKFVTNNGPRPDDTQKAEYSPHYDLYG